MKTMALVRVGVLCLAASLVAQILLRTASAQSIDVLVFANDPPSGELTRLNGAGGINATGTTELGDINPANLANFDVFYAGSEFETYLDSKASILQEFLSNGSGIVVGQANVSGSIAWLPSGLDVTVHSIWYPEDASFVLTASGLAHPIFAGLAAPDFGGRPADTIYRSGLGPGWEALMVHSTDSQIVGMAAGTYGNGRVLLWPDRYDSDMGANPSDALIRQAYEWVAIPEPATLGLLAAGVAAICVRKRRVAG